MSDTWPMWQKPIVKMDQSFEAMIYMRFLIFESPLKNSLRNSISTFFAFLGTTICLILTGITILVLDISNILQVFFASLEGIFAKNWFYIAAKKV